MSYLCQHQCEGKTEYGYCRYTWCVNPLHSNLGTAYQGQGVQMAIITNADRIRAMSDEELAVQLALPYLTSPPWCSEHITCPYISEDPTPCDKCALDWLRGEVDTSNI